MVVSVKDSVKLIGISVMMFCAVTVCNLFLNYYLDLSSIADSIVNPNQQIFFDARLMTAKVICAVSGGSLAATTVVMLFFHIKHYIDGHSEEIGILKALGYSRFKIAKGFSVFGLSVLIGCLAGYLLAFFIMPGFYSTQNEGGFLPEITIGFHWQLSAYLVILPTLVFAVIAVGYSMLKLNLPCVKLLKGIRKEKGKNRDCKEGKNFVADMRNMVLRSKKTLVFFIGFSAFCFSDMIQMSTSMDDLASEMAGIMIFLIGVLLAFTTLYISVASVIRSNQKNIAMMRVFGYTASDCKHSVLDGYRPAAYIGFAIGTVYQYALLRVMIDIVFAGVEGVPEYKFDYVTFFITLGVFIITYESIMLLCSRGMRKISLKQIMNE